MLVTQLGIAYMDKAQNVSVSVTGTGSGVGFSALTNGTADVCASSRDITESENLLFKEQSVTVRKIVIAYDRLHILVNSRNKVDSLTSQQVRDIFTGRIVNWKEVGGEDLPIVLVGRDLNSGTASYLQSHFLRGEDYSPMTLQLPTSYLVKRVIGENEGAIGYAGGNPKELTPLKEVAIRAVQLSAVQSPPDLPPDPLSRLLYLFTTDTQSPAISGLLSFILSEEGQTIIRENGFVGVNQ